MLVRRIAAATRVFGAPPDWKEGDPIVGLPVRDTPTDQGNFMVSAWEPTPQEIEALKNGASLQLWVRGTIHPVVAVVVDETAG